VLFLGDSFSMGAFGKTFDQTLRNAGFEVYTSIAGGGTPYYWLNDYSPVSINIGYWERTPDAQRRLSSIGAVPKVEALMAKWDPDIVVVQTGTNLYSTLRSKRRSKEANVQEVESLISKMGRSVTSGGQRRCYWITPPDAHPGRYPPELQSEMLQIMRRAGGRYGRVFDSYAVTEFTEDYPPSDGIHLGPSDARRWGERAARDFVGSH
jgi:lysophospholipase L1-like esterase